MFFRTLQDPGEVNYVLSTPDWKRQRCVCHINMLKAYYSGDDEGLSFQKGSEVVHLVGVVCDTGLTVEQQDKAEDVIESDSPFMLTRLSNSETLANLPSFLSHLNTVQRADIVELLSKFSCI